MRWRVHHGIIANPNCSTMQLVVVLKPLMTVHRHARVVGATYQSVSGTGKEAMDELLEPDARGARGYGPGQECRAREVSLTPIAFNCLPHSRRLHA